MTPDDSRNINRTPGDSTNALHAFLAKKQSSEQVRTPDSGPVEPRAGSQAGHDNEGTAIRGISNVLSGIFSPLFAPTFALVAALWITPLAHATERARFSSAAVVFFITAIIPLGIIIALMRTGKVSDMAITDRRQRSVPFALSSLCYFGASFYLRQCQAPSWLCLFFIGAGLAAICALAISLKWKISAHLLGLGGVCGMLIWLAVHRLTTIAPVTWIIAAIVLSGAVASSRIFLNRHTPAQTYGGWALGLVLTIVTMSL